MAQEPKKDEHINKTIPGIIKNDGKPTNLKRTELIPVMKDNTIVANG